MDNPDLDILWQWGNTPVLLNMTVVYTWIAMALLIGVSWVVSRRLSTGREVSRLQLLLEMVVTYMRQEIRQISRRNPDPFLPFVGTLFLLIAVCSLLEVVPGYQSPMSSWVTPAALALCVLVAVPLFGIAHDGVLAYLKKYIQPSPVMLPFNLIGEASRTLALAVRLYGNVLAGSLVVGMLIVVVPVLLPTVMRMLGLLLGMIQSYIFAVLAMVYISSGLSARESQQRRAEAKGRPEPDADAPEAAPDSESDEPSGAPPEAEAPAQEKGTSHVG